MAGTALVVIRGDGSGYGWYGSGYGDGGSGYLGYGYGAGYGDGSGYGDGDGDGDGSGDGSGGYGDGYGGSRYGDGSGSGSGSGSGYGDYWQACVKLFAALWPKKLRERLEKAKGQGATIAYWRSDKAGSPCNGGTGKPVTAGQVDEIAGPLELCRNALHATWDPPNWKGDRLWIVALFGETQYHELGAKFGALKREILGEAK